MRRLAGRRPRFGAHGTALLTLAVVAVVLPFALDAGQLTTATFVLIAAIGTLGLNVLTGYTGQVSLGHAFFLAVGAYTAAVLGGNVHLTAAIWLPAAGVIAAACGAVVGPTALRLHGLYLAIVTLGMVYIGQHVWFNVASISGGPGGRSFPPVTFGSFDFSAGRQLSIGGLVIDHNGLYYYLALLIVAAAMVFVWNLSRSRPGRAMQAVREREIAAAVLGVNLARTKTSAFVISSFLAGVSGALYASYLSFVTPGQWNVLLSVQYVAAIIVGGIGTVWGPLLGAIVIFALPSVLQSLVPQSSSGGLPLDDISSVAFGLLVIVFFVLEPRGIVGLGWRVASLRSRARARRGDGVDPSPEDTSTQRRDVTWAR
jgi:branched-chain amino acid transport system permease protein